MSYHRLTPMERYQIAALINSGMSLREIGKGLKRSASTISREIMRNSGKTYGPLAAQKLSEQRRAGIGPPYRINKSISRKIRVFLLQQWSPEQIAARLKQDHIKICFETIYQYVYEDYRRGGKLYLNLRRHRKWRRTHKASRNLKNVGIRQNQAWIAERPKVVDRRKRIGDFERDTLLGKKGTPVLLTIVDRTSRLTRVAKIKAVDASLTHKATVSLLKSYKVRTITNDNGPEFALHKKTAHKLKAKIYFNDPYSAWQRGTNENTNGLIRQYYPKGYDFNLVTRKEILKLETLLNNRPRKCLGFKTPLHVHKKLSRVLR